MRRLVLLPVLALLAAPPVLAQSPALRHTLAEATVRLDSGCTGALAERAQLVVTALHCVKDGRESVGIRLSNGEQRTGWVVATDDVADQAVLFLETPAHLTPLRIARRTQIRGTVLFFSGHPDRPRPQEARLDRIGTCPSLPQLPNALFTTIHGQPGDSGAPLVDGAGEIVGLVHGGAQCQIATPANTLLALVHLVLHPPPPVSVQQVRTERAEAARVCRHDMPRSCA